VGDADDDGDADIVAGNAWGTGLPVLLWLNDGRGGFAERTASRFAALSRRPTALLFDDLDVDGDPDLLLGNAVNQPDVLLTNHDRQLFAPLVLRTGHAWSLDVSWRPGYGGNALFLPFFALGVARTRTPWGILGLDPASLVAGWLHDVPTQTGTRRVSFAVPKDGSLLGLRIAVQALVLTPGGPARWRLTNTISHVVF
jgi:hypothetical protein